MQLLAEGVIGYVLRTEELQHVAGRSPHVMRGKRYCSPEVTEFLEETTGPLWITPEQRRILGAYSRSLGTTLSKAITDRLNLVADDKAFAVETGTKFC